MHRRSFFFGVDDAAKRANLVFRVGLVFHCSCSQFNLTPLRVADLPILRTDMLAPEYIHAHGPAPLASRKALDPQTARIQLRRLQQTRNDHGSLSMTNTIATVSPPAQKAWAGKYRSKELSAFM